MSNCFYFPTKSRADISELFVIILRIVEKMTKSVEEPIMMNYR